MGRTYGMDRGRRTLLIPRDYQQASIDAVFRYYESGHRGNVLVASPTGTGKALMIALLVGTILWKWPTQRIMVATHNAELIKQDAATLERLWSEAPYGIFSAELRRRDTLYPILFVGIGSAVGAIPAFGKIDVFIVDEAHLISDKEGSQYQKMIAGLKAVNPNMIVVGFTATPYRMKVGLITDGTIFDDIVYDLTSYDNFNRLVSLGYLAPLVSRRTKVEYDISNVGTVAGEYNQKELAKAVSKSEITQAAVSELVSVSHDRHSGIIFADSIEHAEEITSILSEMGEGAGCVHSKQPAGVNSAILSAHRDGELKWLVNKDKLTTGYDFPPLDVCGMLRHTMSPGLWVQMLGRLTRPYDFQNERQSIRGFDYVKTNALVLDFARNSERLGPINDPKLPKAKGKGTGDAPIKLCDSCGCYNHASARRCEECGAEFLFKTKISQTASQAEVMRSPLPIVETYKVSSVLYTRIGRPGSYPMLKAEYTVTDHFDKFTEIISIENPKARPWIKKWWQQRHSTELPETVDEALRLNAALRKPQTIRVHLNEQPRPKILSAEF